MPSVKRLTDRKREAIINAAIAEFLSNGFETTSMDKIAASAEVSKRTVYNHFSGKDELFAAILSLLWNRCQDQMDLAYRSDQPVEQQLLELMRCKMRMLNDNCFMDLARMAIADTIHSPQRAREMVAKLSQREESLNGWVRAAQADGKLKPVDPAFAVEQLQALIKAFAFWPQATLGLPPLSAEMQRQVVESAVEMFLAQYACTGAKPGV